MRRLLPLVASFVVSLVAVLVVLLVTLPSMAQSPDLSPSRLVDPAVQKLSDGMERPNAKLKAREAYLPILYPSSHAANLLELKNGDLLCVWFSGTWEGESGVGIVVSRRPAGKRNWEATRLIDNEPGVSYQNPVLFQAHDGTVHLFHTTQGAKAGEANAHVLHVTSKDSGKSWSKPELLFAKPGAFTRHPLLILKDGTKNGTKDGAKEETWMLPLTYVTSHGIGKGSETNYSVAEISRDGGKNWKECAMPETFGKVQPTVVPLANGQLRAFFRSRASDFIYTATSGADGCSWGPAEATVLPNNNASVQAFRLASGHIAMIFDNSSQSPRGNRGQRKPVSVALSEDEGKTWRYVRDVETGRDEMGLAERNAKLPGREEYSYPTILQTRSGEIVTAYTYRRQTIKVVSITEDWIKAGSTVGEYKGK
jgi:predicted neuraminidase